MPTIGYVKDSQGKVLYKVDLPRDGDVPGLDAGQEFVPVAKSKDLDVIEVHIEPVTPPAPVRDLAAELDQARADIQAIKARLGI